MARLNRGLRARNNGRRSDLRDRYEKRVGIRMIFVDNLRDKIAWACRMIVDSAKYVVALRKTLFSLF
jgi:hypothetical protein